MAVMLLAGATGAVIRMLAFAMLTMLESMFTGALDRLRLLPGELIMSETK